MKKSLEQVQKRKAIGIPDTVILLIFLFALFLLFSLASENFLTYANISTMLNNMVVAGIIAVAITPLIVARGLDISFGASLSLSTVVMAIMYNNGINLYICLIVGLALPIIVCFFNGVLSEFFNLIPLILTLGTTSILVAIAQVLTSGHSVLMLTDELYYFATKSFFKIPYPLIVLVLVIAVYWYILSFTKIGKEIYIIGSNPQVARLSGIRVRLIKILLYVFMGLVTGIASIVIVALSGIGYAYHGSNLLLPVLAAVFLGGMSLTGGEGSIWKTLIGVIIITIIFTGLSLMNIQFYFIQIFQGIALIVIVAFYETRKNRRIAHQ